MTPGARPLPELEFGTAAEADLDDVVTLVQSAYRGDESRAGRTTEADLLAGQRVDRGMLLDVVERPNAEILTARSAGDLMACCELQLKAGGVGYLACSPFDPRPRVGASVDECSPRVSGGWRPGGEWSASR